MAWTLPQGKRENFTPSFFSHQNVCKLRAPCLVKDGSKQSVSGAPASAPGALRAWRAIYKTRAYENRYFKPVSKVRFDFLSFFSDLGRLTDALKSKIPGALPGALEF